MALDKDKAYFWREAMMQDKKNFIEKIMKSVVSESQKKIEKHLLM